GLTYDREEVDAIVVVERALEGRERDVDRVEDAIDLLAGLLRPEHADDLEVDAVGLDVRAHRIGAVVELLDHALAEHGDLAPLVEIALVQEPAGAHHGRLDVLERRVVTRHLERAGLGAVADIGALVEAAALGARRQVEDARQPGERLDVAVVVLDL